MRFKAWMRRIMLGTAMAAAAVASTGCDEEAMKATTEAARLTRGTAGNSDGDVDGRDFLIWQRGGSLTPISTGDLADWQSHYGAGG